ncbi:MULTISPECIES: hypothetical protein [unclassified Streptomyces]|uniref:hypothetical protein n=1 Tax=unclassified Streptomyces TaxID=2593676 RepID=UPI0037F15D28
MTTVVAPPPDPRVLGRATLARRLLGLPGGNGVELGDRAPDMDRGRCGLLVEARNAPWHCT